ncbi:hypothetical protein FV242_01745 [Methylobacterium sp. WL64]|uniref:hypothetical protein n=1 Tax=Methylobacterium sp. WL64 TaxID=2603894 RepID=UPI0011CA0B3B|nr:hypothetical protein [Methylobacterium sp. WL64]TXN05920.1 hypothetical protein FV242_01745 [Methylobacterium sp. WL64]
MPFDFARYVFNLNSSFDAGGAQALRRFLSHHLTVKRWVVASDYNTGTQGTDHDVYAFAVYPISLIGIEGVRDALRKCFPRDFKHTSHITWEQKHFPATNTCFVFVFLVSKSDRFLRSGDRTKDLIAFRNELAQTIAILTKNGTGEDHLRKLRMLHNQAGRRDFSLAFMERMLLLGLFNAFVTAKLTANIPVDRVWWVTDDEGETRYCNEVFGTMTYLNYHALWTKTFGRKPMPQISQTDLTGMDRGLSDLVDDLIRIPDFFAAVLARWRLQYNTVLPPPGTKRPAIRRYFHIMRYWLNENENLWLAICRPQHGGDLQTGRIITAKSPRRLERYRKRVAPSAEP